MAVGFLWGKVTFRNKTKRHPLEIVEDFACEAQTLGIIRSCFFHFSFFPFFHVQRFVPFFLVF